MRRARPQPLVGSFAAPPAPLLPFDMLFSAANVDVPRLSPDGKSLVWVAPVAGAPNRWVASVGDLSGARPLTHHTGRGVASRDVGGNMPWRWTQDPPLSSPFTDE
jgi:hypothetical protein